MIKSSSKYAVPVLAFLLLTVLDLIVVEGYYRPNQAWSSIWIWHGVYLILYVGTSIAMSIKLRSFMPLAIIVAFVFGIEDTVFYMLQFTLPARYLGVEILGIWQPSLTTGLAFNLLGLILIGLCQSAELMYRRTTPSQLR